MRVVPADKVRPVVTGRHVGPRTAPLVWKEKTPEYKAKVATLTPNSMSRITKENKIVKMSYDDDDDDKPKDEIRTLEKQRTDLSSSCESEFRCGSDKTRVMSDSSSASEKERKSTEKIVSRPRNVSKQKQKKTGASDWLVKKFKLKS